MNGKGQWDSSERSFFKAIEEKTWNPSNFQIDYLAPKGLNITNESNLDQGYKSIVQSVLDEFNFVGVFDRFDESLVVLSLIADVPVTDVLFYLAASRCGETARPAWVTPSIEDYLSNEFLVEEKADFLLYQAANKSLDLTIEKLGRERVQEKLDIFNRLIKIGSNHAASTFKSGCGIPGITPFKKQDNPFVDMHQLPWFKSLNEHDKNFIQDVDTRY